MSQQASQHIISAGRWYALLSSDDAKPEDYEAWRTWKASDPGNEKAWAQVEAISKKFKSLPTHIGSDTLLKPSQESRRLVLKQLAVFISVGAVGTLAYQQKPWQKLLADQTTAAGEIREVALADGSRLFIHTNSVVNLSFNETERSIELIKGEIYIETAQLKTDSHIRLKVMTQHGNFVALGTKFNVRDHGDFSRVSVYEGIVEVSPIADSYTKRQILAGQSSKISKQSVLAVENEVASNAWTKGLLIVFSMPLPEFISELSRYRTGVMRCDPALAHLKVTGNFLTHDIEAVLSHLSSVLPIRIDRLTRYWVTVKLA